MQRAVASAPAAGRRALVGIGRERGRTTRRGGEEERRWLGELGAVRRMSVEVENWREKVPKTTRRQKETRHDKSKTRHRRRQKRKAEKKSRRTVENAPDTVDNSASGPPRLCLDLSQIPVNTKTLPVARNRRRQGERRQAGTRVDERLSYPEDGMRRGDLDDGCVSASWKLPKQEGTRVNAADRCGAGCAGCVGWRSLSSTARRTDSWTPPPLHSSREGPCSALCQRSQPRAFWGFRALGSFRVFVFRAARTTPSIFLSVPPTQARRSAENSRKNTKYTEKGRRDQKTKYGRRRSLARHGRSQYGGGKGTPASAGRLSGSDGAEGWPCGKCRRGLGA